LISTLKEIKDLSEENLKEEEQLRIYELEMKGLAKTLVDLNAQQEEASRLNGKLTNQLGEKEAYCGRLQNEGSKKVLDEMLGKKISPLIKNGMGFKEKDSSNKVKDEGSTSQVKEVQVSNNNKEIKVVGQQQQHGK